MSTPGVPDRSTEIRGTVYFSDGNLVLSAARDAHIHIVFRVYKEILAIQSSVFEGMLALPGCAATETYDGVTPLVRMPDHADDLQKFLEALYFGGKGLPIERLSPHTPEQVEPILKLATKYEVDSLRDRIIKHLEGDWPTTLLGWDILEAQVEVVRFAWSQQGELADDGYFDDQLPEPVSAIILARKYDIPSILPAAYYHLSRLDSSDDWDELRADDCLSDRKSKRTAKWKHLDAKVLIGVLRGRSQLAEVMSKSSGFGEVDVIDDLYNAIFEGKYLDHIGENPKCTRETRLPFWNTIYSRCQSAPWTHFDLLCILRRFNEWGIAMPDEMCWACQDLIRSEVHKFREDIWSLLPQWFELKG